MRCFRKLIAAWKIIDLRLFASANNTAEKRNKHKYKYNTSFGYTFHTKICLFRAFLMKSADVELLEN